MSEKERPRSPIKKIIGSIKERFKETPALFIDIEDLIGHPKDFSDLKKIRTVGYPIKIGRKTTSIPIPRFQNIGSNVNILFIDWITETIDTYQLHISKSAESPSLPMVISGSTYGVGVPVEPEELNLYSSKYSITGKVVISKVEGDAEEYLLKASKVEPYLTTEL